MKDWCEVDHSEAQETRERDREQSGGSKDLISHHRSGHIERKDGPHAASSRLEPTTLSAVLYRAELQRIRRRPSSPIGSAAKSNCERPAQVRPETLRGRLERPRDELGRGTVRRRLAIARAVSIARCYRGSAPQLPVRAKGSELLSWLRRRRWMAQRIEAEAEALINERGVDAYREARRRERESKSKVEAKYWTRVALLVAQKRLGRDIETRTKTSADLVAAREEVPSPPRFAGSDPHELDELVRVIAGGAAPGQYRLLFLGAATAQGSRVLEEVGVHASDVPGAIRQAIRIAWPPQAIEFRLFDHEDREVFGRQNDDPYS